MSNEHNVVDQAAELIGTELDSTVTGIVTPAEFKTPAGTTSYHIGTSTGTNDEDTNRIIGHANHVLEKTNKLAGVEAYADCGYRPDVTNRPPGGIPLPPPGSPGSTCIGLPSPRREKPKDGGVWCVQAPESAPRERPPKVETSPASAP